MFFECLDCQLVSLDPEMNTWSCPACGSEHLELAQDNAVSSFSTLVESSYLAYPLTAFQVLHPAELLN